jgi:hypothetical protein
MWVHSSTLTLAPTIFASCCPSPQLRRSPSALAFYQGSPNLRVSARHSECAISAISLALYVASVLSFSSSSRLLIIISEGVLAPHKVVVARDVRSYARSSRIS